MSFGKSQGMFIFGFLLIAAGLYTAYKYQGTSEEQLIHRGPAGALVPLTEADEDTKKLNAMILAARDAEGVRKVIKDIIAWDLRQNVVDGLPASTASADAKLSDPVYNKPKEIKKKVLRLYAIAAHCLKYAHGIIYKLSDILESSIGGYGLKLSVLRSFRHSQEQRPAYHRAIFEYLTEKNDNLVLGHAGIFKDDDEKGARHTDGFSSEVDLQRWVGGALAPFLNGKMNELRDLIKASGEGSFLKIEARMFMRPDRAMALVSNTTQKDYVEKTVLVNDLRALLAFVRNLVAMGYWLSSFDLDGHSLYANRLAERSYFANRLLHNKFSNMLGDKTYFDNFPSVQDRKNILLRVREKKEFEGFLTLRTTKQYLEESKLAFAKAAVAKLDYLVNIEKMTDLFDNEAARKLFSNPRVMYPEIRSSIAQMRTRVSLLDDEIDDNLVTDFNTLEDHSVKLSPLFDAEAMGDLALFFPNGFGDNFEFYGTKTKGTFDWNYYYGRPESYPFPSHYGIFPAADQPSLEKYTPGGKHSLATSAVNKQSAINNKLYHVAQQAGLPFLTAFLSFFN